MSAFEAAGTQAATAKAIEPSDPATAAAQVREIAERVYAELLRHSPWLATYQGDRSYDRQLDDLSPTEQKRHDNNLRQIERDFTRIDLSSLAPSDRLNADIVTAVIENALNAYEHRKFQRDLSQLWDAPHALGELANFHTLRTPEDAETLATRLGQARKYLDQRVDNLVEGARAGIGPAKVNIEKTIAVVSEMIDAIKDRAAVESSPYLSGVAGLGDDWSEGDKAKAKRLVADAVEKHVRPALTRFRQRLNKELLPLGRPNSTPGVGFTPKGDAFYQAEILRGASTRTSADELHQEGLRQVETLDREVKKVVGELAASSSDVADKVKALGKNPTSGELFRAILTAPNPPGTDDEVVARAKQLVHRFKRELMTVWGVKEGDIPEVVVEADPHPSGSAYYLPGSKDGLSPAKIVVARDIVPALLASITAHEYVHHLQFALWRNDEDSSAPKLNGVSDANALVEGQGLYGELLAREHGFFKSSDERFGNLADDMLRASRLVLDTGLHSKGWSRDRAIEYMMDHCAEPRANAEDAVDRYVSWPGQALGYKVGQLAIVALREEARDALGAKFDEAAFNRHMLSLGPIPLSTLETSMRRWIDDQEGQSIQWM